jgi:hypothetical protein
MTLKRACGTPYVTLAQEVSRGCGPPVGASQAVGRWVAHLRRTSVSRSSTSICTTAKPENEFGAPAAPIGSPSPAQRRRHPSGRSRRPESRLCRYAQFRSPWGDGSSPHSAWACGRVCTVVAAPVQGLTGSDAHLQLVLDEPELSETLRAHMAQGASGARKEPGAPSP